MEPSRAQRRRMGENLRRTLLLIEVQQELKLAMYRKLHPGKTDRELQDMISLARLRRKASDGSWK